MLKKFWRKLRTKSYAKGLIFSMRAAIFNASSKNPQMDFKSLIKIAIPLYSKDWQFLKSQNNNYLIYKDSEKIKIEENDDFAEIIIAIADTEIRNMHFGVIKSKNISIEDSGQLILRGIEESGMIAEIIREEINKYSEDDFKNWRKK